jgi:hypothetical protein
LPKPAKFTEAVRNGEVTEEVFEKYGAAMTLQWLAGLKGKAAKKQELIDAGHDVKQAVLEEQRAKAALEAAIDIQDRLASGLWVGDEEMPDNYDPFPDDEHPSLSTVDWEGFLVASLLQPIDDDLEQSSEAKDKNPPEFDDPSFWVSHQQIQDIFQEGTSELEHSRGMRDLTTLMETMVMEATTE